MSKKGTKWSNWLCVVGVNCVKKLLQLLGGQDSIREVGFEFVEGQFSIICQPTKKNTKSKQES